MTSAEALSPAELLDRANHLPFSEEERDVLHEALTLSRESGDEDSEYRARLALTASYRSIDDSPSFLTHFSAAAGMHDRDPQRFPGQSDGSYPHLFWQYKEAVEIITSSAYFSRQQAGAILDQMEAHFRAAGVPETAVDIARRDDAVQNGHPATALALQAKVDADEAAGVRDPFDDCPTCRLAARLHLDLFTGDTAGAREMLMQILDAGDAGCRNEPEGALARYMLTALKEGDAELAAYAQRTSASVNPRILYLSTVGRHLEFLGVTGNHSLGLGMLQRYQRDLLNDPLDTAGQFLFLAGAWVLLTATERAGFGQVVVASSGAPELAAFYGGHDGHDGEDFSVSGLASRCAAAAEDLARRYDGRNGNDNYAERFAAIRENTTLDIPLDLGSTNLLLRAQSVVTPPAPQSDVDRADRLLLALNTGARQDAARYADPDLDLPPARRLRHLDAVMRFRRSSGDAEGAGEVHTAFLAELAAQDRPEAQFVAGLGLADFVDIPEGQLDLWRAEIDRLAPDNPDRPEGAFESWAYLTGRLVTALMVASGGTSDEGVLRSRELVARLREADALAGHGLAAVNFFSVRLSSGELADPAAAYASLRDELVWPTTVPLDTLFAQAAVQAGVEDGFPVIDRLLADLIDLGMREVTARVALGSVDALIRSGRRPEAVERAQLAVRELSAAGYPTRDAELSYGEALSYAGRHDECREVLEPLLVPRLRQRDGEFSAAELDAALALGVSLAAHRATAQPAGWVLLQVRDIAVEQGDAALAVAAVNRFADLASGLEDYDAVVEQLRATLPAATALRDDRQSELRLRDRMAVAQSEAGDPAALDTLQENLDRAQTVSDQVYVRESFNRVLYTFGRLDESLAGCAEIAAIMLDRGDPDNAAAQFNQGAQYAVWAENLPEAVRMLEQAVRVPGVHPGSTATFCSSLANLTDDLGQPETAARWRAEAERYAAAAGQR
jgi:tetratricopeptide (TPR) repeat protein